ncbi:MAG: class II aldolase/adducin family protein [Caulobacteraceae bacterium]
MREDICRFARSLFERGLTPGSSGNISVRLDDGGWLVTPDQRLPRLPRPGAAVAARRGGAGGLGRQADQGDSAARGALRQPVHGAGDRAPALHPRRGRDHAAGDRPQKRPAAADALFPDEVRRRGHAVLLPPRRPGRGRRHPGPRRQAFQRAPANHGPVVAGDTLEAAVFATEELEETAKLYLLLRGLDPRYLSPEQVRDLISHFGLKDVAQP